MHIEKIENDGSMHLVLVLSILSMSSSTCEQMGLDDPGFVDKLCFLSQGFFSFRCLSFDFRLKAISQMYFP